MNWVFPPPAIINGSICLSTTQTRAPSIRCCWRGWTVFGEPGTTRASPTTNVAYVTDRRDHGRYDNDYRRPAAHEGYHSYDKYGQEYPEAWPSDEYPPTQAAEAYPGAAAAGDYARRAGDGHSGGYAGRAGGDYADGYSGRSEGEYAGGYSGGEAPYPETEYQEDYPRDYDPDGAYEYETEDEEADDGGSGGLPKKALMMVLIAIGLVLAVWGVWSLTSGDDKSDEAADRSGESVVPSAPQSVGQPQQPGQQPSAARPAPAPVDPAHPAPAPAAPLPDGQQVPPPAAPPAPAPPVQPGAPAPAVPAGEPVVHVFNNSVRGGWAAETERALGGDYRVAPNQDPNLQGTVVPQLSVFFDRANPDAERQAREIAGRLGGVAVPFGEQALPEQIPHGVNDVAVILAG